MAMSQWGRKETIIWPPHSPIYTYGAIFLAVVAMFVSMWLRFTYTLTPLQQFYVPYYLRTEAGAAFSKTDKFQLLLTSDGTKRTHFAYEADVVDGRTLEASGKHIPLQLSPAAEKAGYRFLYRGQAQPYKDVALHQWMKQAYFEGKEPLDIFGISLWLGLGALLLQLPFSIKKDIERRKVMKYGRRLKGPVMHTPKEFNATVNGTGIGFKSSEEEKMIRLPEGAEDKHIEIMGDTGSGKTTLIIQLLRQIQSRGHAAIIHDPAGEFTEQFYDESRGDIILNPLDRRMPYWGPSEELRRKAEAKALATSLYQPATDKKGEFFTETPQKIFAHLLTFGPSPQDLVEWLCKPDEIDRRVAGTEMESMIAKGAQDQRNGVLASLGLIADSLRILPKKEPDRPCWSAAAWAEDRKGWIFLTSKPTEKEALIPLHSLWIDLLVMRLLSSPRPDQVPAWFVLDELASLQRLPQLAKALTENRKSRNPLVLGFQGKAQLEVIYGHIAEVMLSQPATKIFLTTTEPKASEWVSKAIGNIEIERMKETHYDGSRSGKNFAMDRQIEPLVMDSEISGLASRTAILKHGNDVTRFSFDYSVLPKTQAAFIPRDEDEDDLMFDPVTLQMKAPKQPPTAAETPKAKPRKPKAAAATVPKATQGEGEGDETNARDAEVVAESITAEESQVQFPLGRF
jgi:type IV secretory pathway TraG/TraD family ATPase VirD4